MYQIFFHIASITILEIGFFFYYIGPMETTIFLSYIDKIIRDPLKNLDIFLDKYNINRQLFIEEMYNSSDNEDIVEKLREDQKRGKKERMDQNNDLFIQTIQYWSIICGFAFFLFFFDYFYKYLKNKKKRSLVVIHEEESDLEGHIELPMYRKSSAETEDDIQNTLLPKENKDNKMITQIIKLGSHYILFGGSIITFQYLFFKYVVFAYKPLSIEEIKYYIYNYMITN